MDTQLPPVDKLVATFVTIRDERERRKAEWEAGDKQLAEQLATLNAALLEHCAATGADSVRTAAGTVIRSVKARYWTNDWDSMYKFIQEQNAFPLLERRLHQTHMQQFLESNPGVMPAGLNVEREYTVVVRRPKAGSSTPSEPSSTQA